MDRRSPGTNWDAHVQSSLDSTASRFESGQKRAPRRTTSLPAPGSARWKMQRSHDEMRLDEDRCGVRPLPSREFKTFDRASRKHA
jgi:hypothetical protein